jgi:alanine-synthesizing transaminase
MNFADLADDFTGETHPLYELLERLRGEGREIVDLVKGNVSEAGIQFPQEILDDILLKAAKQAAVYKPDPFGQISARNAISSYCNAEPIRADRIVLTPGTSLSYLYCFRMLAQAGDEILCPTPSYPLLDFIARMAGVTLRYYNLSKELNWQIDIADLEQKITHKTRAIVLITPHNPTGMVCSQTALELIAELAKQHQLPIISDEVFNEFLFELDQLPRIAGTNAPLVLTLNGLSKSFALPGMKLGWIAVSGEEQLVKKSLSVLETISDTFLPVNETVQFATAEIFERGKDFQQQYKRKVSNLRKIAIDALDGTRFCPPQGGFYITVKINCDEVETAMRLLKQENILVHPGHFYEIEGNHLVATFIYEEQQLAKSLKSIVDLSR